MVHCVFTVRAAPPPTSPPLLPSIFFFFLAKVTFWQCIFLYLVVGHSGSWTWTCPQIVCVQWRLQHLTKDTFFLQQRTQNTDKTSHLPICIPVKQHTCKPRTTRGWNVPVPHGSEGSHLDTSLMWSVFLQRHLKWTLCDERKKNHCEMKLYCYCWLTCVLSNLSPKLSCNLKGNGEFYSNECNNGFLWSLHCVPKHVSRVGQ